MKMTRKTISVRLDAFLVNKHLPLIMMMMGLVLALPALWAGWGLYDDAMQRIFLLSANLPDAVTRLYLFLDPSLNAQLMDKGVVPWWTYEGARVFFFRPLAALSLRIDYQLWPNSSALMHLHSALWYGLLCASASLLYRRLAGSTPEAGLAAILYTLSSAHINSVFSLAARNLLMTSFFGILAIYFHRRWRKDHWRTGLFLALSCFVLSVLSAETGVATIAYLLAYAIFLDDGSWKKRLASLAPYLLVTLLWAGYYQASGHGTGGSGFYLNPVREPLQFASAILERTPLVLFGQWISPDPVAYAVFSSGAKLVYWILALLALIGIGILLAPLVRKDRTARFWCLGMLIAVIPVCAISLPSGRHLLFIGVGAFGLMGQFIIGRFYLHPWSPSHPTWRTAALVLSITLVGLHVLLYPLPGSAVRLTLDRYSIAVTDLGPLPGAASQDVIIVNAPSPGQFIYVPATRELRGQPNPAHTRILAPGYTAVTLTRLDEHTLVVRPESGYLTSPGMPTAQERSFLPLFYQSYAFQYGDKLFRGDAYPMVLGQRVQLTGVLFEVVALTEDGRPQEARIQFERTLEDEALIWLMWDWSSYQYLPFPLPEIGVTIRIPGPS